MFDSNAFLMSYLLANQQKADLESRKVPVPSDFELRTAMVGAVSRNAGLAALVMQNEVSGLEPKASEALANENKALQEQVSKLTEENVALQASEGLLSDSVKKTWTKFLSTFCNADPRFIQIEQRAKTVTIRIPDGDWEYLKDLIATDPRGAALAWIRLHFSKDLHPLMVPEHCGTGENPNPADKQQVGNG